MLTLALDKIQLLLLLISPFRLFAVIAGLIQKISGPGLKNLPTDDCLLAGSILQAIVVSDHFWIKNRFKRNR